jgi:hypothetical protein
MSKIRYSRVNKIENMLGLLDESLLIKIYQSQYDEVILALESIKNKGLSNAAIKAFKDNDEDFAVELLSTSLDVFHELKCIEVLDQVKEFVNFKNKIKNYITIK